MSSGFGTVVKRGQVQAGTAAIVVPDDAEAGISDDPHVRAVMARDQRPERLLRVGGVVDLLAGAGAASRGVSVADRVGIADELDLPPPSRRRQRHVAGRREEAEETAAALLALGHFLQPHDVNAGPQAVENLVYQSGTAEDHLLLAVDQQPQEIGRRVEADANAGAAEAALERNAGPAELQAAVRLADHAAFDVNGKGCRGRHGRGGEEQQ